MNHAVANLAERLRLFYHKKNLLKVNSQPEKGTEVIINLPGE
jgi:sensor histidine kinase YesM